MNIVKKVVEKTIEGIGPQRINRALNRFDVKFEIAKQGATYYEYYWRKAFKKAAKTANGGSDSRKHFIGWGNKFFAEYQGCEYEDILGPVPGAHDLQVFHILAFH